MLKNNKGYSMVELLAMIFITTMIIYPLMSSLVNNIEINERLHLRQSATSIASTSLYGFEKISYSRLRTLVNEANTDGTYFVEFNIDQCDLLDPANVGTVDESLCEEIFGLVSNNFTATSAEYRVFIYNFNITEEMNDTLRDSAITSDASLPVQVKDQIGTIPFYTGTLDPASTLLRVTVWIQYYNDPPYYVVLSGLIFDEGNNEENLD